MVGRIFDGIEARVTSGNVKLDFTEAVVADRTIQIEAEVRSGNLLIITRPGIVVDADDVVIRSGNVTIREPCGTTVPVALRIRVSGGSAAAISSPGRRGAPSGTGCDAGQSGMRSPQADQAGRSGERP